MKKSIETQAVDWLQIDKDNEKEILSNIKKTFFKSMSFENWANLRLLYNVLEWQFGNPNLKLTQAMQVIKTTNSKDITDIQKNSNHLFLTVSDTSDGHIVWFRIEYKPIVDESFRDLREAKKAYPYIKRFVLEDNNKNTPFDPYKMRERIDLEINLSDSRGKAKVINSPILSSLLIAGLADAREIDEKDKKVVYYYPRKNMFRPEWDENDWYKYFLSQHYQSHIDIKEKPLKPEVTDSENVLEKHKYFSLVSLSAKIKEPFIFVIMPFDNKIVRQSFYKDVIKRLIERHTKLGCYRSDDDKKSLKVDNKIFTMISKAQLVIADVTRNNPNVMYELGIAHTLEKDVILITNRNQKEMPFDIGGVHAEKYKDG